jgi:hypothetical protein
MSVVGLWGTEAASDTADSLYATLPSLLLYCSLSPCTARTLNHVQCARVPCSNCAVILCVTAAASIARSSCPSCTTCFCETHTTSSWASSPCCPTRPPSLQSRSSASALTSLPWHVPLWPSCAALPSTPLPLCLLLICPSPRVCASSSASTCSRAQCGDICGWSVSRSQSCRTQRRLTACSCRALLSLSGFLQIVCSRHCNVKHSCSASQPTSQPAIAGKQQGTGYRQRLAAGTCRCHSGRPTQLLPSHSSHLTVHRYRLVVGNSA